MRNNLKFFMTGVMVCAVVAGGVVLASRVFKNEEKEQDKVNANVTEYKALAVECNTEKKEALTIISSEKKYQEEFKSENYEIVVKNTSGSYIEKISLTLGEGIYELYNINPEENYKFVAFDNETDINLKVLSITYETKTYGLDDEISLERKNENGKISGSIKNNGQRKLYPAQIVYFVTDSEGNTIQRVISYAGCFFEGLVINPEGIHEFEEEIPQGYTLNNNKGIMVMYSDLEFKYTEQVLFK